MALKQPVLIRDKVAREVALLFRNVGSFVSCLPELEPTALEALGGQEWLENTTDVTNLILERLGHDVPEGERRYDKARRALAKMQPEPPLKGGKAK